MGVGTNKVVKAAVVCVMVNRQSSNGRQSSAGSSFVNFPVDPNETEKNQIAKFGYSGDPKNRIFGYSADPKNQSRMHPNLAIITQNR
jgi:hypothetical protein